MQYVELHARSAFSFLEGASLPEALVAVASAVNMPAMALLDRDGFYGSPRFHIAAQKAGMRAHVGAELTVQDDSADGIGAANFPLLCESRTGYQNLCRLMTRTKLRVPKRTQSSARLDELEEFAIGLVCLTGDENGPLAKALDKGGVEAGRRLLQRLISIFGVNNVYVELQRHLERQQEHRNHRSVELAYELELPILATQGVCYATAAEREILDVFTCIRH